MDRRIIFALLAALCLVVLLSCSQVFEAGISGTVVTKDGTRDVAVSNVNVFAYTDKGLRDSDLAKFQAGTIKRPSEGSGYVASTTTNANGEFVVNKIVWETKKSEFGKTADVNKLYLIFYHEDYKVASTDATIISGSTNQSNVYMTLEGNKDYTTINVTVRDVATGRPMTSACTLKYYVGASATSDTIQVTGATEILISYPSTTEGTSVKFILSAPGAFWEMTDNEGHPKDFYQVSGVKEGTYTVNLYMKSYEFALPAFSGSAILGAGAGFEHITFDDTPINDNDDVKVWLEYHPVDQAAGVYVPFAEIKTRNHTTEVRDEVVAEHVRYYHGEFSGVGSDGYTVTIRKDGDYSNAVDWTTYDSEAHGNRKTVTLKLRIVFGDGSKKKDFDYTIGESANLGTIDLP